MHVYGYCFICFETLSGFDQPVGYLYNKTLSHMKMMKNRMTEDLVAATAAATRG
jgi:hypothetical protein